MIEKYLKDLNFLRINSSNLNTYVDNRKKSFSLNFKSENQTKYINTISKENLSPTMYAYYFCEKSNRVLSDNKASTLRMYDFDLGDENSILKLKKDCDEVSL